MSANATRNPRAFMAASVSGTFLQLSRLDPYHLYQRRYSQHLERLLIFLLLEILCGEVYWKAATTLSAIALPTVSPPVASKIQCTPR